MKKSIALVAMAFGVTSAFAQDLTSKKGEPFLPEAGDYAIGIDATPFLNYAGNFFGTGAANVAPTFDFHNTNYVITGKKFKSWSGNLIVSGLASQKLHRCNVKDNKIIQEEIILSNSGRVRNVIQGPDESLYVSCIYPYIPAYNLFFFE